MIQNKSSNGITVAASVKMINYLFIVYAKTNNLLFLFGVFTQFVT